MFSDIWVYTGWTKKMNPILFTLMTLVVVNMRENSGFTDIFIHLRTRVCNQIVLLL